MVSTQVDMFGAGLMKTVLALREAGQLPKPDPANPPANPCNLADSVPGALGDCLLYTSPSPRD